MTDKNKKVLSSEQVQYAIDILKAVSPTTSTVATCIIAQTFNNVYKMADCEVAEGQKRMLAGYKPGLRYYDACMAYINEIPDWS